MNTIGLYLHIPFCRSKCPYCDFYSFRGSETDMDKYCAALQKKISESSVALQCKVDTLYIGGGTPSVLGAERLKSLVNQAKRDFLTDSAEITVECNPYKLPPDFFKVLAEVGVNRVSLGLQSAVDTERRTLGRLSDSATVEAAVKAVQTAGIQNISLDVMLGVPDQTEKSLAETLDFCLLLGVPHISAYILKLEENTPFWRRREQYNFPDDDQTADLYLQLCETLETGGILQYEISNFAKSGFESRHNLKYWHCEEYLGLGPAAHSFLNGKRFYFPRDFEPFLQGGAPVPDGNGGDFTEYAMLALRLTEGLRESQVQARFGHKIPDEMREKAKIFVQGGYMTADEDHIALTRNGFLLSNAILAEIL
ncbi:MAG: radical SAM family heme chaperone HemW [Candidatus Fimenecus sp.]